MNVIKVCNERVVFDLKRVDAESCAGRKLTFEGYTRQLLCSMEVFVHRQGSHRIGLRRKEEFQRHRQVRKVILDHGITRSQTDPLR